MDETEKHYFLQDAYRARFLISLYKVSVLTLFTFLLEEGKRPQLRVLYKPPFSDSEDSQQIE